MRKGCRIRPHNHLIHTTPMTLTTEVSSHDPRGVDGLQRARMDGTRTPGAARAGSAPPNWNSLSGMRLLSTHIARERGACLEIPSAQSPVHPACLLVCPCSPTCFCSLGICQERVASTLPIPSSLATFPPWPHPLTGKAVRQPQICTAAAGPSLPSCRSSSSPFPVLQPPA